MKIDELNDILSQILPEGPNWTQQRDAITIAARIIREAHRTGFITDDCRVQRYPEQAQFRTKDGAIVKPGQVVFAGERPTRFEIAEDGTVACAVTELIDGQICMRDLRADECYSTKAAATKAARRAGK